MSKELKCFLAVWTNMVEQVGHLSLGRVLPLLIGDCVPEDGDRSMATLPQTLGDCRYSIFSNYHC